MNPLTASSAHALNGDVSAGADADATAGPAPVLGVARSLGGRRWVDRSGDTRAGLMLAQRLAVPELVGRVMAARGIGVDDGARFLDPTLRDHLTDPSAMRDVDRAVERLVAAIGGGESIAVFGDYDVDGATSSALLARYLAAVGVPVRVYIPDRIAEGYGPTAAALSRLRSEGHRVVITVDCGIAAFDALAAAADAGLDVIVVDHHIAEPTLPTAAAVIDPNRLDDDSGLGHLAAVGVTFMLLVALNRRLRAAGAFRDNGEPNLLALLDLVALGTVCDVVPLTGLNRAFVAQGLAVMRRRRNPGLAALADVGGVDETLSAYHLGYVLGPRVNAGGRVGEAGLGAQLLMIRDGQEAARIARRLDAFNAERRRIEAEILAAAEDQVAAGQAGGARAPLIFAAGDHWHPGVIGIVAGRLAQKYGVPAFVIGLDGDLGKGSGRSVAGVDLGAAVIAARQHGLLVNGGGHAMAAGLTVARERLADLRAHLEARIGAEVAAKALVPSLGIDGALSVGGATPQLCDTLERLQPFGAANAEPRFAVAGAVIANAAVVGTDHVRIAITDGRGKSLKGIAFRAAGEALGEALLQARGRPLHLAGKLRHDRWQGRDGAQLLVDDAAWADGV